MSRLPNYRKLSDLGLADMLNDLKRQQQRSQFSPRILASDGEGGMTRDQAIGNDALAGALVPWSGVATASNFGLSAAWSTVATLTVPVPDGFTRALVNNASAQAFAWNSRAVADYLYTRAYINADATPGNGYTIPSSAIAANDGGGTISPGTASLFNLSGQFTVNLDVSTNGGAWAADAANVANLYVALLFLR